MILSEIKISKTGKIIRGAKIVLKCDDCGKEWDSNLYNREAGIKTYGRDLCRGCKQRVQVLQGLRKKQYVNAGLGAIRNLKGKTAEEIHGEKRAKEIKKKISAKLKGNLNPNYGGKHCKGWGEDRWKGKFKGKTIEEIWGEEKGKQMRLHYSKTRRGSNNNMYGRPSPTGSGNGWSGWYNGWYFRSLKELSYMIFVIERFNFKWESAERKKYRIDYIDWDGNNRTYRADFLINDKYLVEIKPKNLWNSASVKNKKDAAEKWCKKHNLIYKLTESPRLITFKEIDALVEENKIVFTKRYQEKYKKYKQDNQKI